MAEKKAEKKENISQEQLTEMFEKSMKKAADERAKLPAKGDYTPEDGIPFPPSDDGIVDKD